jgi:hypothetical protein
VGTFNCGILYAAIGQRYIDEAITSAQSSLRFNRVPHLILCDQEPPLNAEGIQFGSLKSCGYPYWDKAIAVARLPFERTLFLDTDTYVLGDLGDVFELLDRVEIAAAHPPAYTKAPDPVGSAAFYDFNTGVIALRRTERVKRFLEAWIAVQQGWGPDTAPFAHTAIDQHAFRRALWESDAAIYVLGPEYNYRSVFPGRLVGQAKIIHGRHSDYEAVAARLNAAAGPRSFDAFER